MTENLHSVLNDLTALGVLRPPGMGLCSETGYTPFAQKFHRAAFGKELSFNFLPHTLVSSQYGESHEYDCVILGVPSGSGGGALPGASLGPIGIREALLGDDGGKLLSRSMDLGDVLCIPHLLHDDLLNEKYIGKIRSSPAFALDYSGPVSPLSILEFVVTAIKDFLDGKLLIVLGGDHSISASTLIPLLKDNTAKKGILHIDAHTDLAPTRYGLEFAYGSWAHRVLENTTVGTFVQIGLNEIDDTSGTRQILFDRQGNQTEALFEILLNSNISELHISIDIDAFDASIAPATGIPRKNGMLFSDFLDIVEAIPPNIKIRSIDIVEVAPTIGRGDDFYNEPTCKLAARILSAFTNRYR